MCTEMTFSKFWSLKPFFVRRSKLSSPPTNSEIHGWLQEQKYQTEREDTGEYSMYFDVDMPKILEEYHEWRKSRV